MKFGLVFLVLAVLLLTGCGSQTGVTLPKDATINSVQGIRIVFATPRAPKIIKKDDGALDKLKDGFSFGKSRVDEIRNRKGVLKKFFIQDFDCYKDNQDQLESLMEKALQLAKNRPSIVKESKKFPPGIFVAFGGKTTRVQFVDLKTALNDPQAGPLFKEALALQKACRTK